MVVMDAASRGKPADQTESGFAILDQNVYTFLLKHNFE